MPVGIIPNTAEGYQDDYETEAIAHIDNNAPEIELADARKVLSTLFFIFLYYFL